MVRDSIPLYAEMVEFRHTKRMVRDQLNDSAWIPAKNGKMPTTKTWKRKADVVFKRDDVQFHFFEGLLKSVAVEFQPFTGDTSQIVGCGWKELRTKVERQLGKLGSGDWTSERGATWRRHWFRGPVLIEALSAVKDRRRSLSLSVQIPKAASQPSSLEDLFAY